MKYLAIKLKPKSFLHLGEREQFLEGSKIHVPSDTLFSALCHCYLLLYGQLDEFLEGFVNGNPPFLLSSAFPWSEDDLFFPLPKNQLVFNKELKKIRYVNQKLLSRLLSGEKLDDFLEEIKTGNELKYLPAIDISSEAESSADMKNQKGPDFDGSVWKTEEVPRVSLNRLNNSPGSNFFHFGQVAYADQAGLFVLLEVRKSDWQDKIKALFRLLCDEGVGGDRSCGKGFFHQPEFFDLEFPGIESPQAVYALSCYFPRENEIDGLAESFYELEERRGYVFSPVNRSLRRRAIRLFSEGSVFKSTYPRLGQLVDVKPGIFKEHPVYRYGYLLSIPCKLEET